MGTEEKEWTDVANDLLTKCHIILKVKDLTECDANVFVALYEAILGEKVPDFISPSRSQEENAHNVQAIIDSLALDYLQVSLSHITGENIVKGEKESIKNLLEIFDGLLEYLTEQISEASSQPGDDVLQHPRDFHERVLQMEPSQRQKDILSVIKIPSTVVSSTESSDILIPSWEVEGSESTGELIRLGETAHTFTLRKSDGHLYNHAFPEDDLKSKVQMLGAPIRSAIPLQPPYQPVQPRPETLIGRVGSHQSSVTISPPLTHNQRPTEPARNENSRTVPAAVPQATASVPQTSTAMPQTDVTVPPSSLQGPTIEDEALVTRHSKKAQLCMNQKAEQNGTAREEPVSNIPKKVAFCTLPDIRVMTFQNNLVGKEDWKSVGEEEGRTLEESQIRLSSDEQQTSAASETSVLISRNQRTDNTTSFHEAPFSRRRAENRLSEQELREMSENLARKLNELDLMLKQALGDRAKEYDFREEDKLSQHSDSFMEYRKKKHLPGYANSRKTLSRPRSLSSSPPLVQPPTRYSFHTQFEDALNKDAKGQMKSLRRELQKELDQQRIKAKLVTNAYEEEIKSYEDEERIKISKLKAKLKEKEQEFKENFFQDLHETPQPAKAYARKTSPQKLRQSQWFSSGGVMQPRKAIPMKIKENDLLPLLLDEFPYLHISPHVMNKMWKHQISQLEQLTKSATEEDRSRAKLQNEVEVTQKKHDLLVEIIRKEQEHNRRLHEFKERICQQKSTQNKMREKRQQIARAKKYYEDYHVQLKAKMMRAKTREELIFKNLFEEGLEIQKERLRDIRSYAKEKREEQSKRHKDELESMENYYKDQFSMLAEAVSQERHEIKAREKAQENTLSKMKRGLRAKMEKEIRELQDMITKNNDDTFFRELEAERLKRRIQMASFQYSKSHLL